ncbi:hypothetical protein CIT31_02330 [Mesorhizobium wenxiniae]|uniref:Uncharacterized protein n=1 Tax=Mesorhizobium wenxiniae TaxID=2014805 RepID=A0A271KPV7_9HYPH|nr:hypothetical protein CIT31_02330 [Mesorhizobium wenxiniae]
MASQTDRSSPPHIAFRSTKLLGKEREPVRVDQRVGADGGQQPAKSAYADFPLLPLDCTVHDSAVLRGLDRPFWWFFDPSQDGAFLIVDDPLPKGIEADCSGLFGRDLEISLSIAPFLLTSLQLQMANYATLTHLGRQLRAMSRPWMP